MNPSAFIPIDPKGLKTFANERDLLRDLFAYLDYVGEHSIKRMVRSNEIPRGDLHKIAKCLGGLPLEAGPDEVAADAWVDYVDCVAYRLGLVKYDVKGTYRGYTSSEPSFIDNYITVNQSALRAFSKLSPVEQEKQILETFKQHPFMSYADSEYCEFFQTGILGILDRFDFFGSATGVIPLLDFPRSRQFLLDVLAQAAPGKWYNTAGLVDYLKLNHPYFLIPQKIPKDRYGKKPDRYENFYEGGRYYNSERTKPIADDAPDGFERVEGRFVERFLENIPLVMRFVEVAYDPAPYKGLPPSRGTLKAFRVTERFIRLMRDPQTQPRVTVQPNFDVVVESDFYPGSLIAQMTALGEPVSSPMTGSVYVGIFQLKKTRVAAEQVRQPNLDVIALLKQLSGRDLPPNVQIELEEWSGHADQFTLYQGLSLLESTTEIAVDKRFIREQISPNLCLVREPDGLFQELETAGLVPLRVKHGSTDLTPVAEGAVSLFPKETAPVVVQKVARPLALSRVVSVTLKFPDDVSFDAFRKMLAELRCPFQSDPVLHTLTYDLKNQPKFDEAAQKLASDFTLQVTSQ